MDKAENPNKKDREEQEDFWLTLEPLPVSRYAPSVKMCLERPAGRDKHEIINNFSAKYAQSATEGISNRTTTKEATGCQSGSCGESRP